jgi:hypothetical protein
VRRAVRLCDAPGGIASPGQQLTADRIPVRDASFVWKLKF